MRATFLGLFFLFIPTLVVAQTKMAFVVGVERYDKNGLSNLEFAEEDAKEVKSALEKLGFRTLSVIGNEANLNNLNASLERFMTMTKALNKSDIVMVYFSGHGVQKLVQRTNDNGEMIETEEPFFCPKDALKSDVATLLPLNTVLRRLQDSSGSDQNIIMLDICRDSADKGGRRGIDGSTFHDLSAKLALFFAAESGHQSYESKWLKHGIFTHYLLIGLQGEAADSDNEITFQGLATYVLKEVERNSPKLLDIPAANAQRPNWIQNLTGTIVLGQLVRFADESVVLQTHRPFPVATTATELNWTGDLNGSDSWVSMRPISRNEWDIVMQDQDYSFDFLQNQKNCIPYIEEYCRKLTLLELKAGRLPYGWAYDFKLSSSLVGVRDFNNRSIPEPQGNDDAVSYSQYRVCLVKHRVEDVGYSTKTSDEWKLLFSALLCKLENDESLDPRAAWCVFCGLSDMQDANELSQLKDAAIQRLTRNGFFRKDNPVDEIYKAGILAMGCDIQNLENAASICKNHLPKTGLLLDGNTTEEAALRVYSRVKKAVQDYERKVFPNLPEQRMVALNKSLNSFFKKESEGDYDFIGKIASVTPKSVPGRTFSKSEFQGDIVIAYNCCEPCGIGYHTYAMPNALYEKWRNHPIEFVICCPAKDNLSDEFEKYFQESMPNWKFASILVDEKEYGTDSVPRLTVLDKKGRIRFVSSSESVNPHSLAVDPFVNKLIEALMVE